jgi:alpha-tubulin suppressor-like RCC1 family protein
MGGQYTKNITEKLQEKIGMVQTCTTLSILAKGDDEYGNVSNFSRIKFVDIWTQNFQSFGIDNNDNLYSWGLNDYCQVGNEKYENYHFKDTNEDTKDREKNFIDTFTLINPKPSFAKANITKQIHPLYGVKIKKISAGEGFTICIDVRGMIFSWGKGQNGQLGYELDYDSATIVNKIKCQSKVREIEFFTQKNIKIIDVQCGRDFTFVKSELEEWYSFGNNDHGQLCRNIVHFNSQKYDYTPDKAKFLCDFIGKVDKLQLGYMHGIALNFEKTEIYIWGNPFYDYDNKAEDIIKPYKVTIQDDNMRNLKINDIASGFHHFLVCTFDGSVYTFGANDYGQLGYDSGEQEINPYPKKIRLLEDYKATHVYAGAFHSIIRGEEDHLLTFGHN